MKSIKFREKKSFLDKDVLFILEVDGIEYLLPYRFQSAIDFEETLIVLAYPKPSSDDYSKFEQEGCTTLFAFDKKSRKLIWTKKRIWNIWSKEIRTEADFLSKKGYDDYVKLYQNRETIIAHSDDWEKVFVVESGEELVSCAIR
ncbi:MAG: hypothetical protein E7069_06975 [Bacteroidales bacterium]|jgi:hypothetical protein|nr:hypothetical protein [Bacteroidales bacterium]